MLGDSLEGVENHMDKEDKQEEVKLENVGAKYLKMVNSVFFSDVAIFTVKLPISEH